MVLLASKLLILANLLLYVLCETRKSLILFVLKGQLPFVVSAKLMISEMADLVLSMVKTILLLFAIAMNSDVVVFDVSRLSKVPVCLRFSKICLARKPKIKPRVWRS